jgi:outer membrane biosynthesis protein TonB
MDEAAVEAIRKARFDRPPPGLSPDDRTYIIDYVFG